MTKKRPEQLKWLFGALFSSLPPEFERKGGDDGQAQQVLPHRDRRSLRAAGSDRGGPAVRLPWVVAVAARGGT